MASQQQQRIRSKYFGKKLKAKKVIDLYQAGERNFQGAILRGQSFKGQDLSEADFSEADIRSANYTNTTLVRANFSRTKSGLLKRWVFFALIILFLLFGLSGYIVGFSGGLIGGLLGGTALFTGNSSIAFIIGLVTLAVLCIFFIITIQQSLEAAIQIGGFFLAVTVVLAVAIAYSGQGAGIKTVNLILVSSLSLAGAGCGVVIIILATALAITLVGKGTLIFTAEIITTFNGIEDGLKSATFSVIISNELAEIIARAETVAVILFSAYLGWYFLSIKEKDTLVRRITILISAIKGTSFFSADLTKTNFKAATLKGIDFRKANLTCVCWNNIRILDRVCPGDTYLKDAQVRQWLIGKGTDKNFDGKSLKGVNLQRANLTDASFIATDLGEADLTGANLTGACIEDWIINNQTKLDDVICDYIYLKDGNQERIPHDHNRTFKPDEFAKYIEKAINTVDLIFTDGIDWKAFFASLETLQKEYGAENIGVQAIERKSGDTFIVRIEVPPKANKAEIESKAKQLYETNRQVLEAQYRAELQAKDREINIYKQQSANMIEIVKLQASRPINVEAKAVAENQLKNVEVEMNINAPSKGVVGKMTGDMNIYTSEQKQSLTEVATEIVKLLDYFEQNDPSITEAQQIVKTSTENQPEILDAEIVEEAINSSPTLKQRLGAAGIAAYIETVKVLLPPFGVAYEAYKAFRNPES